MKISVPIRLGFLGGGNIAEAILNGVIEKELLPAKDVYVTDIHESRRQYLAETTSANVVPTNIGLLKSTNVVMLAVKPQDLTKLLAEIRNDVRHDHLILSVCAGKHTETIEEALRTEENPQPRVIRIMPNTPARVGLGMAGICKGRYVDDIDVAFPQAIFEAVGEVVLVEEEMMDAVTAISGSGPAYVFFLMEMLIQAAVEMGFTPEEGKKMVIQTFLGASKLASESPMSPEELRQAVTSRGGTTAAGLAVMDELKIREGFIRAAHAAKDRSIELSQA